MWTGISALLLRNMRLDSRQLQTHIFRLIFAVFIYFCLFSAQIQSLYSDHPGLDYFRTMAYLNAAFICLGGVSFFASAITEEKEEETLGLLQMANIGPLSVLLGKSTSRLWQALLLLLVQFPFGLLAVTLGGITWHQVFCVYVSLSAFTVWLANAALLCSVISARTTGAATLTAAILFLQMCLSTMVFALSSAYPSYAIVQLLSPLTEWNIFTQITRILSTSFNDSVFSVQVIGDLTAGLLLFGLARLAWGTFAERAAPAGSSRGWLGVAGKRYTLWGPDRAWWLALAWKDFHFVTGGINSAIIKFFAYPALITAIVLTISFLNGRWMSATDFLTASSIIMVMILVIEGAMFSSVIFHDEIRLQTMSSLLMLPRPLHRIVLEKVAGCLLGLLPTMAYALACFIAVQLVQHDPWLQTLTTTAEVLFSLPLWMSVFTVLIFYELTALLSLYVRWGALPLSFFIVLMFMSCCPIWTVLFGAIAATSNGQDRLLIQALSLFLMLAIFSGISFVFYSLIVERLRQLGAK